MKLLFQPITRIIYRAWLRSRLATSPSRYDVAVLIEAPAEEVAARLKAVLDPVFDLAIGEVSLPELLRQQVELQREYGARAARELVLVSKQLMYFERYARELAPDYTMARDLFLMTNIFPEDVARVAAARGIELPGDDIPNVP